MSGEVVGAARFRDYMSGSGIVFEIAPQPSFLVPNNLSVLIGANPCILS